MLPTVKKIPSGYRFEYSELNLIATASRIRSHRDGRVTAEFLIETTAPGNEGLLHQSQLNLLSTRSRQTLCRELASRFEAPWSEIVEQASSLVLENIRKGEPLQYVSTIGEIPPVQYLISPLIPLHQPTIIFGMPGSMKSYTAILSAVLSTLPWHDNPLGFCTTDQSTPALYLDYESSHELISRRVKKLQRGLGLPEFMFAYHRCASPFADYIDEIHNILDECGAKFLIIDSIGGACGGDIYAPEPAIRFFSALRSLEGVTTLILAHTSKELSKEKTILGTVYFTAYARQIWETRISQEPGQDEVDTALFHRKSNEDQLQHPIGLHFIFNEEQVTITRTDVQGIAAFIENLSLTQQITETLKGGAMPLSELAETLGVTKTIVAVTLSRMKSKNLTIKLPDKKWGLADRPKNT